MQKGVLSYLKPVLFSVLIGLISATIYFCASAVLVSSVDISSALYYWISLLGIAMLAFITSFTCAKIIGKKALLTGILCAVALILLLLLGSIIIDTGAVSIITKSSIIALISIIGAVFGVN